MDPTLLDPRCPVCLTVHCQCAVRPVFRHPLLPRIVFGLLLVLLVLTNPNEAALGRFVMNHSAAGIAPPQTAGEAIGQGIGMALMPSVVEALIVRHNCLLFSVFVPRHPEAPGRAIGIAGQFIWFMMPDLDSEAMLRWVPIVLLSFGIGVLIVALWKLISQPVHP